MAIHGRFWAHDYPNLMSIERIAVIEDVKRLDKRKPDKVDREAIRLGSYVVCKALDGSRAGREELYHIGYLKAEGGWPEIHAAIEAAKSKERCPYPFIVCVCERSIAVNADGTVRKHKERATGKACAGAGRSSEGFTRSPFTSTTGRAAREESTLTDDTTLTGDR